MSIATLSQVQAWWDGHHTSDGQKKQKINEIINKINEVINFVQSGSVDNLGNHIATQNLNMSGYAVENGGYYDLDADSSAISRSVRSLRVFKKTGASSGDLSYFDVGYSYTIDAWVVSQWLAGAGVLKDLIFRFGSTDIFKLQASDFTIHFLRDAYLNNYVLRDAKTILLNNNAGDTFDHRIAVYDTGGNVSYGIMLWNSSGTTGDWATMIYGPNQANRRISFGKINSAGAPTTHADITEGAYFDLDDWSLRLTSYLQTTASQDQLRFAPSGYDKIYWMYKPASNILFGIWNSTASAWKFQIDTSGNIVDVGYISMDTAPAVPSSTSRVNIGLTSGALLVQTTYGYVNIGPRNASWCHFYTDRARFYFDKRVIVNSGVIGSYDEDLQLVRTNSGTDANKDKIYLGDGHTTFYFQNQTGTYAPMVLITTAPDYTQAGNNNTGILLGEHNDNTYGGGLFMVGSYANAGAGSWKNASIINFNNSIYDNELLIATFNATTTYVHMGFDRDSTTSRFYGLIDANTQRIRGLTGFQNTSGTDMITLSATSMQFVNGTDLIFNGDGTYVVWDRSGSNDLRFRHWPSTSAVIEMSAEGGTTANYYLYSINDGLGLIGNTSTTNYHLYIVASDYLYYDVSHTSFSGNPLLDVLRKQIRPHERRHVSVPVMANVGTDVALLMNRVHELELRLLALEIENRKMKGMIKNETMVAS